MKRRRFILGGGLIAASPFMAAAQGGQTSGQARDILQGLFVIERRGEYFSGTREKANR